MHSQYPPSALPLYSAQAILQHHLGDLVPEYDVVAEEQWDLDLEHHKAIYSSPLDETKLEDAIRESLLDESGRFVLTLKSPDPSPKPITIQIINMLDGEIEKEESPVLPAQATNCFAYLIDGHLVRSHDLTSPKNLLMRLFSSQPTDEKKEYRLLNPHHNRWETLCSALPQTLIEFKNTIQRINPNEIMVSTDQQTATLRIQKFYLPQGQSLQEAKWIGEITIESQPRRPFRKPVFFSDGTIIIPFPHALEVWNIPGKKPIREILLYRESKELFPVENNDVSWIIPIHDRVALATLTCWGLMYGFPWMVSTLNLSNAQPELTNPLWIFGGEHSAPKRFPNHNIIITLNTSKNFQRLSLINFQKQESAIVCILQTKKLLGILPDGGVLCTRVIKDKENKNCQKLFSIFDFRFMQEYRASVIISAFNAVYPEFLADLSRLVAEYTHYSSNVGNPYRFQYARSSSLTVKATQPEQRLIQHKPF